METDHKPLVTIFQKPLYQTPFSSQKMLLQLQSFDLKVRYKAGKELYLADTPSRCYLKETQEDLVSDLEVNMVELVAMSPEKYREFQEYTGQDPVLDRLRRQVLESWPIHQRDCPYEIRNSWTFKEEISYQLKMVCCTKGTKSLFPKPLDPRC